MYLAFERRFMITPTFITGSRAFIIKNFAFVTLYARMEPLGIVKFDELKDNVTMK